jgi:hypothetical protein
MPRLSLRYLPIFHPERCAGVRQANGSGDRHCSGGRQAPSRYHPSVGLPMLIINQPASAVEVVAHLTATTSHCEIRRRSSDDEAGDPIEVRCGTTTTSLGRALKGASVDRIQACQIVLTVNAVHTPQLLGLNNCRGRLSVSDIGIN